MKLFIKNPEQTSLLCYYVFNLARYDQNYDIRDRVRFLRQFTHGNANGKFVARASEIFLAAKPAPLLQSQFKGIVMLILVCSYKREGFLVKSI